MEGVRVIAKKALKEVEEAYMRSPPHWSGRINLYRAIRLLQALIEWDDNNGQDKNVYSS